MRVLLSSLDGKSNMLTGTVKFFHDGRGFGFLVDSEGRDVFVHYSVIESDDWKTLTEGDVVQYELKEGPKGLSASKVVRANQ